MTSKREKIIIEEIQKSINNGSFNVKILSKNRIKIEHNGMLGTRDCFVDRNDLNNFDYNSKITGYSKIGNIVADFRTVQYIKDMCDSVFTMIDDELNKEK